MAFKYIVLCGLVFSQGAWSAPATTSDSTTSASYGSQLSNDFAKNVGVVLGNWHNGIAHFASPFKFGVDSVPSLINNSIKSAAEKAAKLSEANKEAFGKMAVGVGRALGGGGVLGTSVAGGAMQMAGKGLSVFNKLVGAAANAGLDLTGQSSNASLSKSTSTMLDNIVNTSVNFIGDGMNEAARRVGTVSNGLSSAVGSFSDGVLNAITEAEKTAGNMIDSGAKNIGDGALALSSNAQTNVYNGLKSFLQVLDNLQSTFDKLSQSINSAGTTSSSSTVTTS